MGRLQLTTRATVPRTTHRAVTAVDGVSLQSTRTGWRYSTGANAPGATDRLAIGVPTSETRAPAAGHALVGVVTTVVLRLAVEAVTAERLAG